MKRTFKVLKELPWAIPIIALAALAGFALAGCGDGAGGGDPVPGPGLGVGLIWSKVSNNPFGNSDTRAVAYGGGKWVAVGSNGKAAYAEDPAGTWTAITDSGFTSVFNYPIQAIAYGGTGGSEKWVAVGPEGKAAYAEDPAGTWTAIDLSSIFIYGSNGLNAVAYGDGKWIIGGSHRAAYAANPAGTWTEVTDSGFTSVFTGGVVSVNAAAYDGGKWVAVGLGTNSNGRSTAGVAAYATDPAGTWTAVSDSEFNDAFEATEVDAVACGGGKWVIGGTTWTAYSTDGITWTQVPVSTFMFTYGVAFGGGKWVAVGYAGDGGIAYAADW
jgi:hypothetical protein